MASDDSAFRHMASVPIPDLTTIGSLQDGLVRLAVRPTRRNP